MKMMMEDGHGQDLRSLARTLERDQILEVLSGGFCRSCQLLLESRIHTLLNSKKYRLQTPFTSCFFFFPFEFWKFIVFDIVEFLVFHE